MLSPKKYKYYISFPQCSYFQSIEFVCYSKIFTEQITQFKGFSLLSVMNFPTLEESYRMGHENDSGRSQAVAELPPYKVCIDLDVRTGGVCYILERISIH
jgi:hypothetical protein